MASRRPVRLHRTETIVNLNHLPELEDMAIEEGDTVTIEYSGWIKDGTLFDTSRRAVADEYGLSDLEPDRTYSPLTVTVGNGDVVSGLERALIGMDIGQTRMVSVRPEDAYGSTDLEKIETYDRQDINALFDDVTIEPGIFVQTADGNSGKIVAVSKDSVRIDFNHPLKGKTLVFDIEIVDTE